MKCNVSIDGECLFNTQYMSPPMHLIKISPENTKEDIEKRQGEWVRKYYNEHHITSNNVEITKIPLSLIKCDGEKGKDGCPYKEWKK